MKTPTKSELYAQIEELQRQNIKLRETIEREQREEWERRLPDALDRFYEIMGKAFPGMVKSVQLEHIDGGGYWFSFALVNDATRQTYAVRHTDI